MINSSEDSVARRVLQLLNGEIAATGEIKGNGPAPDMEVDEHGMHKSYWILSEKERAKGFVRPYRDTYIHTVCGTSTRMSKDIAETYSAKPSFYNSTYCIYCERHFPVGEHGEFVWEDGSKVGS